ncbi:MAG: methionyl-tRNA formyltransferase [Lachnospiraceae bacterium]|nr:methionyl-tRNA formyltransferase [Lachnospiraceae bacterium]
MKVIFMGTPDFAVGTLERLIEAGHEIVLVVTQPDKPKGRGKEMQYTPVKEAAMKYRIPVFQPIKIREAQSIEKLGGFGADIMVVVAFGQILPKEILDMTPYGCINVHASLLPKYRGAAPIQWAIINGEEVTGVTTMQMDVGLDTGDMILKKEIPIMRNETGGSLHDKLAEAGAVLCVETLARLEQKNVSPVPQGESPTGYAGMLDKKSGAIEWNKDAVVIERLIRGLNPWPSAYTCWDGKIMKIWEAKVCLQDTNEVPGTIVAIEKNTFYVQTGKGQLEIKEIQLPGKKRMEAGAFLRGYQLKKGEILCIMD